ncbi:DUF4350 domain-containing protein [Halomonadaceae bacterium KBTZ08]
MNRQAWLLTVITMVVLVLLGGWLWTLEWKEQVIDGRFTDKANQDPFLVADRFLQQWGVTFGKERGFSRLDGDNNERPMPGTDETLLLLNAYGQLSEHRSDNLLEWVERGGHLIVTAENPFVGLSSTIQTPLFDHFGLRVKEAESGSGPGTKAGQACDDLQAPITFSMADDETELQMAMTGDRILQVPEDHKSRQVADDSGPRLVQLDAGKGQVTFVASAAIWRNAYVGCHDHAYLLWRLVPEQSKLRILHNLEGPSLWDAVQNRASLAALAFATGILLLLWHHGVRFGPVRESASQRPRSLLEHVDAAAHFAWRHRRQERLLRSVQQEVEGLAAQAIPGFRALGPEARHQALAHHAGLDETSVTRAMGGNPTDEHAFLAAMQTLKSLRESL